MKIGTHNSWTKLYAYLVCIWHDVTLFYFKWLSTDFAI